MAAFAGYYKCKLVSAQPTKEPGGWSVIPDLSVDNNEGKLRCCWSGLAGGTWPGMIPQAGMLQFQPICMQHAKHPATGTLDSCS